MVIPAGCCDDAGTDADALALLEPDPPVPVGVGPPDPLPEQPVSINPATVRTVTARRNVELPTPSTPFLLVRLLSADDLRPEAGRHGVDQRARRPDRRQLVGQVQQLENGRAANSRCAANRSADRSPASRASIWSASTRRRSDPVRSAALRSARDRVAR